MKLTIDLTQLKDFKELLEEAPKILVKEVSKSFGEMGKYDIGNIRNNVSGSLKLVNQGAAKSFKFKATAYNQATDFNKLFLTEYTGWKAAEIFQTGGTITGKGKDLTIITPQGRRASGKRQYTQSDIRNMIADKTAKFIPTPHGVLLVQFTKGGKLKVKKGAFVILAILKKSVTEQKRINFYETVEAGDTVHGELLEYAIENTLATIAANKAKL